MIWRDVRVKKDEHQEDLNIMELQKCCVCKMSKEDVKLRVTDDLRCDLSIFKTTNQLNTGPNPTEEDSEVGATGHDDSKTICLRESVGKNCCQEQNA